MLKTIVQTTSQQRIAWIPPPQEEREPRQVQGPIGFSPGRLSLRGGGEYDTQTVNSRPCEMGDEVRTPIEREYNLAPQRARRGFSFRNMFRS
jgi:hypothetical protein